MKLTASPQKLSPTPALSPDSTLSAGPDGAALITPTYGMDAADQPPIQTVSKPGQDYQPLASVTWPGWAGVMQRKEASPGAQPQPNQTGLPDKLKTGIETLSGLALDDVRVHHNSAKPAQLQALAYTQGADIHLGPGQERHLPHEAWHVVQQKQGRVRPMVQAKEALVNNETGLEREAEVMGAKAEQMRPSNSPAMRVSGESARLSSLLFTGVNYVPVIQRKYHFEGFYYAEEKLNDMMYALEGSDNKYLNFFKGEWGEAWIKLDPSANKNPGDASLYYREIMDGEWERGKLERLRKLKIIYGIGAVVNVRKWFFDKYPSGKVLSMLAHEIGVHVVPYMDELMAKLPVEAGVKADPKYIDPSKQDGISGRIDHQRVANIKHVDFELYRDVVKDMMKTMLEFNKERGGQQKASDLADAYLMDLSTIFWKGRRLPAPLTASSIARRYNAYRQAAKLEKDVPPKTSGEIWRDYQTLYKRVYPVVWRQHPVKMVASHLVLFVLVMYLLYWLANKLLY